MAVKTPKRVLSFVTPSIINPTSYNNQALITFSYDDGIANNYTVALPLHEKYKIPCAFHIIGANMLNTAKWIEYMDPQEVKDAHRRGVEISSHSYLHNQIWLTNKSDDLIEFECIESKKILKKIIGKDVETIAIPYSQYDDRVKNIVKKHYSAVRVFSELQNDIPPTDRYWIKSAIALVNSVTFEQVKAKIDEAVLNKKWCVLMFHGVDERQRDIYEIHPTLLEQILQYVDSIGKNVLLPVTMKDGVKFSYGNI